eukprot:7066369-Pyramimonas_sp.AAC.1
MPAPTHPGPAQPARLGYHGGGGGQARETRLSPDPQTSPGSGSSWHGSGLCTALAFGRRGLH